MFIASLFSVSPINIPPLDRIAAIFKTNDVFPCPGSPSIIVILPIGIYGYHNQSISLTCILSIVINFNSDIHYPHFIFDFANNLCYIFNEQTRLFQFKGIRLRQ